MMLYREPADTPPRAAVRQISARWGTIVRMLMPRLLCVLLTAALLAPAAPASAGGRDAAKQAREEAKRRAQMEAIEAKRRGEILPLTRILEIAQQYAPGEVIEVEYKRGPRYKIKTLLDNGRVLEVKLDARTGELLELDYD